MYRQTPRKTETELIKVLLYGHDHEHLHQTKDIIQTALRRRCSISQILPNREDDGYHLIMKISFDDLDTMMMEAQQ